MFETESSLRHGKNEDKCVFFLSQINYDSLRLEQEVA